MSPRSAGSGPPWCRRSPRVLLVNWYFTEPIHTLTIAEGENVLALVVFVFVAAVVSIARGPCGSSAGSRPSAAGPKPRPSPGSRRWLVAEEDPLPTLLVQLRDTFGLDAVSVLRPVGTDWVIEAAAGPDPPTAPADGTDRIELGDGAVLVLRGDHLPAESRRVLSAFAAHMAAAVRARDLSEEAAEAAELAEVDELRTAILQAVSHDLRTPLASIKAAASSLRQDDVDVDDGRAPTSSSPRSRRRPTGSTRLVGNLLDMSRIQSRALQPGVAPVGLDEVVAARAREPPTSGRARPVDVPESLPRVDVDAALLERAIANVVGNALAWSPADEPVRDRRRVRWRDRVELRVDRPRAGDRAGRPRPGVRALPTPRRPCPRRRAWASGWRSREGFVEAMGGELTIEDTPGGGLHDGDRRSAEAAVTTRPRGRRRAADPARPAHEPAARGYEVDHGAPTARRRSRLAAEEHPDVVDPRPRPAGHRRRRGDPRASVAGARCRSSCCRPATRSATRCCPRRRRRRLRHEAVRRWTSSWPGCAQPMRRLRPSTRNPSSRPTTSRSTSAANASAPTSGDVHLTPTEWHLVEILVRNPGKLVSQRQLLQEVWGPQYERRDELPAGLHGPDPAQARARPGRAPVLHHRAGHGLPIRTEVRTMRKTVAGCVVAVVATAALVVVLHPHRGDINTVSEAFAFLFVVVGTVWLGGLWPGIFASLAGVRVLQLLLHPAVRHVRDRQGRGRRDAVRVPRPVGGDLVAGDAERCTRRRGRGARLRAADAAGPVARARRARHRPRSLRGGARA